MESQFLDRGGGVGLGLDSGRNVSIRPCRQQLRRHSE
jgi:hypothetical protein